MVWLWSLASRTCTRKLRGHTDSVVSVRLLGDLLVSGSRDRTARVWSVGSGECVATLRCGGVVFGLAISPRGLIASASKDTRLRVWPPQFPEPLSSWMGPVRVRALVGHTNNSGSGVPQRVVLAVEEAVGVLLGLVNTRLARAVHRVERVRVHDVPTL